MVLAERAETLKNLVSLPMLGLLETVMAGEDDLALSELDRLASVVVQAHGLRLAD